MAFWNVTAGSQVSAFDANGFAEGTDVDQGSIRAMSTGTVFTANTKFTNVPLGEDNPIVTIASGQAGITGANMTAPFPQNADQVITKATTEIAGITNNALLFGASDSAQDPSIKQAAVVEVKLYKTAIRNGEFNPVTAQFDTEPVAVAVSGAFNIGAGVDNSATLVASGTDNAANPTQDVPGELVYNYGSGADPTQDEYKSKNLF
tara:strand:+ start:26 stop:640 length:615 start_codon:yes stop_codon:yes gene_type:complete